MEVPEIVDNAALEFIPRHEASILTGLRIVPLVIEAALLIFAAVKNRKKLKANAVKAYRFTKDSFTPREGETKNQSRKRILKNVAITTAALTVIGGVTAACFIALPVLLAIPAAITAIEGIGKAIYHFNDIKQSIGKARKFVVDAFTQRKDETSKQAFKRIAKNVVITLAFFTAVAGIGVAAGIFFPPMMAIPLTLTLGIFLGKAILSKEQIIDAFTKRAEETNRQAAKRIGINIAITLLGLTLAIMLGVSLPTISQQMDEMIGTLSKGKIWITATGPKAIVVGEYFSLGIAHLMIGLRKFQKGEKWEGFYHCINAFLGFAFPIYRLHNDPDLRIHHDFLGLLIQLAPLRSIKLIGAAFTIDSPLYFINEFRYYDFANIIVDHFKEILPPIVIASFLELQSKLVKKKKDDVHSTKSACTA